MIYNCVLWINAFPPKGGVSDSIRPRTLLTGVKFDYNCHCKLAFGAYTQFRKEIFPTNSQKSRTLGAICLGPSVNLQGGYKFMNLCTGKRLTRRKWTALPMPQEVIDRVNNLGEADGQPSLLTFYDRHGNPVGDTQNTNAHLTAAPEEETEENDTVPDITGLYQEPPNKHQDQEPPDEHKNEHEIDYGTEEVGDLIEDSFQSNNYPHPQDKEPVQLLDDPVPAPTWRSTCFKKPVSRILPSFYGKKYNTAATLINWEHMFATVHPDTHMRLLQGIDYDHVVFYAITQLSMKAGIRK